MNGHYRPLSDCEALAVYAMEEAGPRGLTTGEFWRTAYVSKSTRLAAMVHKINRKSPGLVVWNPKVNKSGGQYVRYYLRHHAPAPP